MHKLCERCLVTYTRAVPSLLLTTAACRLSARQQRSMSGMAGTSWAMRGATGGARTGRWRSCYRRTRPTLMLLPILGPRAII